MKIVRVILSFVVTSQLLACSGGEPTEGEIAEAMKKQIKIQLETTGDIFKEDDISINSIKKVGCSEAKDKPGYNCDIDVDIDIKMPLIGKQKQQGVQSIRFVETNNGWEAVR